MSIQKEIVQKLFESKELYEASFQSGGSTYKCAFGKYYKDGEQITREDYFKAKETSGGGDSQGSSAPEKKEASQKSSEKKEPFQFANMNDKKKFAMDINRHILPNHSKDRDTQVEMKDDSVYVTLGEKDLDNKLLMSMLKNNGFGDPVEGMSFPGRRGTYTTMPYVGGGEEKKFKSKTPEKAEETPKATEKKEEGSIDRSSLKMSPEDSPLHDTEIWNSAVDNLSDEDAKKLLSYKRKLDKAKRAYQKNPSSSNLSQLNSIGRYYEEFEKEVGLRDKDGYPIGTKSRKDSSDSTQDNNNDAPQKSSDSSSFSDMVSTHAQEAGSKMKKDKNGPYFYDGGDKTKFSNAVGSMAKEFSETHSAVSQYQISKSQSCYYDEESGMALVVKNSETPGKSWAQIKKLSDDEVAKLKPAAV